MALVKKRTNSSRLVVTAVAIIAVGGLVAWLVLKFINPSEDETVQPVNRQGEIITQFGEEILKDPRYLRLTPYGQDLNVNADRDAHNPNPFQ